MSDTCSVFRKKKTQSSVKKNCSICFWKVIDLVFLKKKTLSHHADINKYWTSCGGGGQTGLQQSERESIVHTQTKWAQVLGALATHAWQSAFDPQKPCFLSSIIALWHAHAHHTRTHTHTLLLIIIMIITTSKHISSIVLISFHWLKWALVSALSEFNNEWILLFYSWKDYACALRGKHLFSLIMTVLINFSFLS